MRANSLVTPDISIINVWIQGPQKREGESYSLPGCQHLFKKIAYIDVYVNLERAVANLGMLRHGRTQHPSYAQPENRGAAT